MLENNTKRCESSKYKVTKVDRHGLLFTRVEHALQDGLRGTVHLWDKASRPGLRMGESVLSDSGWDQEWWRGGGKDLAMKSVCGTAATGPR